MDQKAEEEKGEGGDNELVEERRETPVEKTGVSEDKSWAESVDEAYTELMADLQDAYEGHMKKIRDQLKKITLNSDIKLDWPSVSKPLFKPEVRLKRKVMNDIKPVTKEHYLGLTSPKTYVLVSLMIIFLLAVVVVNLCQRLDKAIATSETTANVLNAITSHAKLGTHTELNDLCNYINDRHDKMKFTLEIEKENSLKYLDLETKRDGSSHSFNIYRKPIALDLLIPADSHHHPQYKQAGLRFLTDRLINIPLSSDNFKAELKHIATSNGYSEEVVEFV